MRLAICADLHWGFSRNGDAATRDLARTVATLAPDALAIAGDVGEGDDFGRGLELFAGLPCARLVVPGNHDLWTREPGCSSLERYERQLPAIAAEHGFHYLDGAPYHWGNEAVAGSINWYDYSFADPELEREVPGIRALYPAKRFPQGQHNDGRFVHLEMPDPAFTARVVGRFRQQLRSLPGETERVTVVQHHPPVRELFYPTPLATVEQRVWLAYTGNRAMEELVLHDSRIRYVVCGHTHAACEANVRGRRCLNIGGNYHWKRLLLLDTHTGTERWWEFGRQGGTADG